MKFYGVRVGRQPGVYTTWQACQKQVSGFPNARFRSFQTRQEAELFVKGMANALSVPHTPKRSPSKTRLANDGIHIWVDGACLQHAKGGMRFGWAYLVIQGERELHRASGNDIPENASQYRNVAGEIMAVLQALTWCQAEGISAATIYYDYQGLASWVEGTWKTKTPLTQSYAMSVQSLGIELTWVKVKGHSGEAHNEQVDKMAKEAAGQEAVVNMG
ncbi:MAG: hypothetical protein GKS05_07280 [Nitrospirales bacterium]|nr:hypothetical protein [Nitrospirales bacterium]